MTDIAKLKELSRRTLEAANEQDVFYIGDLVKLKNIAADIYGLPKDTVGFISCDYDSEYYRYDVTILDPDSHTKTFTMAAWMIKPYEDNQG